MQEIYILPKKKKKTYFNISEGMKTFEYWVLLMFCQVTVCEQGQSVD
jgi:hypothetical protein